MIADDLRSEMSADGGSDVLVGGSGDDVHLGGDGRDLLIGGFAVSGAATTASQDVVSADHQRDASGAARDTLMASGWAAEESWLSATSPTPSTLNTMVFARRDEYFIDTCDSNAGDADAAW
jgi:Ca2+-binding RTX toxin-like protein